MCMSQYHLLAVSFLTCNADPLFLLISSMHMEKGNSIAPMHLVPKHPVTNTTVENGIAKPNLLLLALAHHLQGTVIVCVLSAVRSFETLVAPPLTHSSFIFVALAWF